MNFQPTNLAFLPCELFLTFFLFFMCFSVRIQVFRLQSYGYRVISLRKKQVMRFPMNGSMSVITGVPSFPTNVLRFNSSYLRMFLLTEKYCFLFFQFFPACFFFLIIVSDIYLNARPFHSFKRCISPMIPVLLLVASEW